MSGGVQRLIVGVFALTSLSLLGIMILLFGGGQALFADTYNVNVHFALVEGVQPGQSVTLNGKRIGATTGVEFWNPADVSEGIRVVVAVDSEFELPAKCRVDVGSSVMGFGRPHIGVEVLEPDQTAKLPKDGTAVIPGRMISTLDRLLPPEMQKSLIDTADGITDLAEAMKPVASNLDKLLEPRTAAEVDLQQATANITTLVERFDAAVKNLNMSLGDPQNIENFQQALANIRAISERGVTVMGNLEAMSVDGRTVILDVGKTLRSIVGVADRLSAILVELEKTSQSLNNPKGTVGSLLNDNRLYEELLLSARRLTQALDDLREVADIIKRHGFMYRGQ